MDILNLDFLIKKLIKKPRDYYKKNLSINFQPKLYIAKTQTMINLKRYN